MADAKITALTDLGTSVATTDILPVVDSTDTTTKRTTIANVLALGPSTVSITSNEVPDGLVNSSNVDYTTASAYVSGSLQVYINGLRQALTTHFTETTPASGTFAMGDAPITGDIITVSYQTAATATGNADTVDNIHASSTATANTILPLNASAKYPIDVISNPYCFRAYDSGGTTLTIRTIVQLNLATEVYDYNNNFSSSAYTVPVNGVYNFSMAFKLGTTSTGVRAFCLIYVDGVSAAQGGGFSVNSNTPSNMSTDLLLTAGQVVTFCAYQDSAGDEVTLTTSDVTYATGHLIHRTA